MAANVSLRYSGTAGIVRYAAIYVRCLIAMTWTR